MSGAVPLAFLLLLVCIPPTGALAEVVEVKHCNAGPGAIFPPRVYENATVGNPYTPREVEIADSEDPPEGSLTATANWGDGTSSPASVKSGSFLGCFILSNSGHTYSNPGAISFSYTLHNAHTGIDHTADEEQFYVWSVPTLVPGSTPGTISAQVGKAWSGVVGEFSYDSAQMSASQYTTRIDWGDLLASPGTITPLPNGRFSVSGSHTYTQPFEGRVVVDVFGSYDTLGLASWPIANVLATTTPPKQLPVRAPAIHYRILRAPILVAIPDKHRGAAYELIFRLSRQLPRTSSGKVEAALDIFGHRHPLATFGSHRSRACYLTRLDSARLHTPKGGTRYPFSLSVRPPATSKSTVSGKAIAQLYPSPAVASAAAAKRLGC